MQFQSEKVKTNLLTFLDECTFAGDKKQASQLKGLLSEGTRKWEAKFLNPRSNSEPQQLHCGLELPTTTRSWWSRRTTDGGSVSKPTAATQAHRLPRARRISTRCWRCSPAIWRTCCTRHLEFQPESHSGHSLQPTAKTYGL